MDEFPLLPSLPIKVKQSKQEPDTTTNNQPQFKFNYYKNQPRKTSNTFKTEAAYSTSNNQQQYPQYPQFSTNFYPATSTTIPTAPKKTKSPSRALPRTHGHRNTSKYTGIGTAAKLHSSASPYPPVDSRKDGSSNSLLKTDLHERFKNRILQRQNSTSPTSPQDFNQQYKYQPNQQHNYQPNQQEQQNQQQDQTWMDLDIGSSALALDSLLDFSSSNPLFMTSPDPETFPTPSLSPLRIPESYSLAPPLKKISKNVPKKSKKAPTGANFASIKVNTAPTAGGEEGLMSSNSFIRRFASLETGNLFETGTNEMGQFFFPSTPKGTNFDNLPF